MSRLVVDETYEAKEGVGVSSKDKQYTPQSNQNGGWVLYTASMQHYISFSSGQRKKINDIYCHGNQVGHSSKGGRMNVSHILQAFTLERAFVRTTTQRHVHIHVRLNSSGLITSESA